MWRSSPFARRRRAVDAARALLAFQLARREPHLADDLRGAEVAVEALLRGRAERAVERAADLRGDAQRAALGLRDEHHLEGLRGVRAQQPLAGAVGGALPWRRSAACAPRRTRGEARAKVLRKVGHLARRSPRRACRSSSSAGARGRACCRVRPRTPPAPAAAGPSRLVRALSSVASMVRVGCRAPQVARVQLGVAEEVGDLARRGIGGVRAVHHVLLDALGQVGADGARQRPSSDRWRP